MGRVSVGGISGIWGFLLPHSALFQVSASKQFSHLVDPAATIALSSTRRDFSHIIQLEVEFISSVVSGPLFLQFSSPFQLVFKMSGMALLDMTVHKVEIRKKGESKYTPSTELPNLSHVHMSHCQEHVT